MTNPLFVGVIHFEDIFYASKRVGDVGGLVSHSVVVTG